MFKSLETFVSSVSGLEVFYANFIPVNHPQHHHHVDRVSFPVFLRKFSHRGLAAHYANITVSFAVKELSLKLYGETSYDVSIMSLQTVLDQRVLSLSFEKIDTE